MSTNGTRWRDPDTGLIANPGNIDLAFTGVAGSRLGSYFAQEMPAAHPPESPETPESEVRQFIGTQRGPALKGDQAALKALRLLQEQEYGRKDGGRLGIKKMLALLGIGKID